MAHPDPDLPDEMPETTVPRPGSAEAIYAGCLCPETDNARGRGHLGPDGKRWFVFVADCPLHGNNDWAR